jgi:cell division protease FtsH
MTRSELLDRLAVLLGGRVAEELVFEEISTGAQNDLQRATEIARSMVTEYGRSDRLGLVTYERPRQSMFLPDSFAPGKNYSEAKGAQIDEEVARFIEEAHQRVHKSSRSGELSLMIWPISFHRRKVCRERPVFGKG